MPSKTRIVGQTQLTEDMVKALFDAASHQVDYVVGLYKLAIPIGYHWDNIDKLGGFPAVSKATSNALYALAMAFDKTHHPKVFAGGAWLNNGFTVEPTMTEPWLVVWDTAYTAKDASA